MFDENQNSLKKRVFTALFFVAIIVLVFCLGFIIVPTAEATAPMPGLIVILALMPLIVVR